MYSFIQSVDINFAFYCDSLIQFHTLSMIAGIGIIIDGKPRTNSLKTYTHSQAISIGVLASNSVVRRSIMLSAATTFRRSALGSRGCHES